MKTIIYYRKSTDRDDKQANSLEHQLNNCRNTAERYNLEIFKEIWESKSAKSEFTRSWFNEMIDLAKSKKIDYIICDEPKRLSRNNIDTSRIIDLLDKKQIKGVLCTSREYFAENSRDKFLLQLDLSLSKMDNEDRAKDVKDKMTTAFKRGQRVGKAPLGYLNVTIKKGHKDIIIDPNTAPAIKQAFKMRIEWYSYTKIADYFFEQWIKTSNGTPFVWDHIKRMLGNKFYMWTMTWAWMQAEWKHKPLVSKEVYLKANERWKKIVYSYKNRVYKLAGILKWTDWKSFRWYTKKDNVYYCSARQSDMTVNISEKLVFQKFWEQLEKYEIPKELKPVTLSMLKDIYSKQEEKVEIDKQKIQDELSKLANKKSFLVDNFLEWVISKEIYTSKLSQIEINEAELEKKLQPAKKINQNKLKELKKRAELYVSLYAKYPKLCIDEKLEVLKNMGAELKVDIKKELHIAESRLMELLEKLHFTVWYARQGSNPRKPRSAAWCSSTELRALSVLKYCIEKLK